jgi:predicted secreted protein
MIRPSSVARALFGLFLLFSLTSPAAFGQDRPAPVDMLSLNASASSEVAADIAVVTLSVVREGTDVAALTQDVDAALTHALSDAKAAPGISAFSGGYSTQPKTDKGQTLGWTVHGDLIVRSRDFAALGKLVGRLTSASGGFQISSTKFEVSSDVRQSEEDELINRAIASFKSKANVASKALGYAGWTIHQVNVSPLNSLSPAPQVLFGVAAKSAPAMPLEAGRVTLQVDISGSVQMRH